jgi:hypothetical protein
MLMGARTGGQQGEGLLADRRVQAAGSLYLYVSALGKYPLGRRSQGVQKPRVTRAAGMV